MIARSRRARHCRCTRRQYVAGAYIVFFALVLIYVAIMAMRLSRVERDLRRAAERRAPRRAARTPSEREAHGSARRYERAAGARHLPQDGARGAARAPGVHRAARRASSRAGDRDRGGARGGRDLDLQPHRGLPGRRRPVRAEADVLGLLARRAGIRPTELAEAIYSPRNCDAARQLYRVTAGLESMIVGEAEIQGQVRRAHEAAMRAGCTGPLSNRLFAAALTTGKRVRIGDRDRLQPREHALGGGRPRAERARRAEGAPRGDPRRGRDQRADRARARRAGRRHDLRRQPPRRSRAQPRPALRRLGRRARRAARPAAARRHRALLDLLARIRSSAARSSSW